MALIAGSMTVFYYWSHLLIVRVVGVILIIPFLISLWQNSRIQTMNRIAFQSLGFSIIPMSQQRKVLEFFRYYAASAEDRVFAALNANLILIILLALTIQPWWFCIALLLHSFCSFHALEEGANIIYKFIKVVFISF